MSAQDNLTIARIMYDAFNAKDNSKSKELVDDSAVIEIVPLGQKLYGKEGYTNYFGMWATAFPDGYCDVKNVIAGSDGVVVEFHGQGTHKGPLLTPSGEIKPTGNKVDIPFCEVFKINNGKIVSVHTYFDVMTMMHQLEPVTA